jgi:hypothetical protein
MATLKSTSSTSSKTTTSSVSQEDKCPVCLDSLQKNTHKFLRYTCCGKGIHIWCDEGLRVSSLSYKQKHQCPLCRATYPTTDEEVIAQLRPWVKKKKAWAQELMGLIYADGKGVEQSYEMARRLYELSASQGYAAAQFSLGLMYHHGLGVDQSYERAVEYMEAAARQGMAAAQSNLGESYYLGRGVAQSKEEARKWWTKAAAQGEMNAIKHLNVIDESEGKTTPSFTPTPFECDICYKPHDPPDHPLKGCGKFQQVYYCDKHWEEHKNLCKKKEESTYDSNTKYKPNEDCH